MTRPRPRPGSQHGLLASVAAASIAGFLWLASETAAGDRFALDGRLFDVVAKMENGIFEAAMVLFTFLGAGAGLLILLSAVVAALWSQRRRGDAAFVVVSLALAQVVGRIVKATIDKPRPGRTDYELVDGLTDVRRVGLLLLAGVVLLALARPRWRTRALLFAAVYGALFVAFEVVLPAVIGAQEGVAFPSGHATSSMTVVLAAGLVLAWPSKRPWRWLAGAAVFGVGVGVSRVAFGLHEPSDVAGGWLLALATVAVVRLTMMGVATARRAIGGAERVGG